MKEQLIERLQAPEVKSKVIEITANAYKDTWDAFNSIDKDKIYELSHSCPAAYKPKNINTPFYYAPPRECKQPMTEHELNMPQGNELPLIDETDNSLFAMAANLSDFDRKLTTGIQDVIINDVLKFFEYPKIATAEEIIEVYKTVAIPTIPSSKTNLEFLWDLFVEKVRYTTLGKYYSKFFDLFEAYHPIDLEDIPDGTLVIFINPEEPPIEPEEETNGFRTIYRNSISVPDDRYLWQKNGISIQSTSRGMLNRSRFPSGHLFSIELCGCMTQKVFDQLNAKVSLIFSVIHKSYSFLNKHSSTVDPKIIDHMRTTNQLNIFFSFEEYNFFIDKIKAYIESYFSKPDKRDSLNRRIRNAVCLLVESDAQSNGAIQVALSIAAIEALLGERGSEISTKLSTNIAVLLEPDLAKRNDAETFFKELYNARSKILHGESLEDEENLSYKARHLASAVLDAVLILRDFLTKSGYELKSPQDFLLEIKASKYRAGTAICDIESYNVRSYWDK